MNINELLNRYSLKNRQSIYEWTRALNIKFPKDDSNKSYATPEQIDLLDQLSEHLKSGNSIKSFSPLVKTTVSPSPDTVSFPLGTFTEPSQSSDLVDLVNAIASLKSPISNYEELEKAANNKWILSTSDIKRLGFIANCKSGEDFCDRGCWRFVKAGRIGRESAWSVEKITKG
jgi:hypothetical protein